MPCVRWDILLAGIRLSIWVLIEVDFSLWLIVMLCRFCNTFSKRSDRIFAVFTDHLVAEHVTCRILYHTTFLIPVITGKLAVILKAQQNRHLAASDGRNQVVNTMHESERTL